jgi:hypothetical protein
MVKIETNVLANIYTVIKWASNRKVHTEQIKKDLHQVKLPFCVALQTTGLARPMHLAECFLFAAMRMDGWGIFKK